MAVGARDGVKVPGMMVVGSGFDSKVGWLVDFGTLGKEVGTARGTCVGIVDVDNSGVGRCDG